LAHPYSAFLVQTSRFMIVEDYGCSPSFLPTCVLLIIFSIPPILLELIAGVYGCLSIHAFYNRSKLDETYNDFHSNRYIRLICFSACGLLCGIPISLFYLYLNTMELVPFPGLTQEHYQFSLIYQLPAVVWRATTLSEVSYESSRWIMVCGAFVFFAIFGFTEESCNNYRATLQSVVQVFVKITGIKSRLISASSSKAEGCVTSFFFLFSI